MFGSSIDFYGFSSSWERYVELILEKACKKTKDTQFDINELENENGESLYIIPLRFNFLFISLFIFISFIIISLLDSFFISFSYKIL